MAGAAVGHGAAAESVDELMDALNPIGMRESWERGSRSRIAPMTVHELMHGCERASLADRLYLLNETQACAEFLRRAARYRPVPLCRLLREGLSQ